MTRKRTPPPNYDYTSRERVARLRARSAMTLSVTLDKRHAEALRYIVDDTDETTAACVRRLILAEAAARGAPIKREE